MSAGRLPQNLLILLYKIKNNEVLLNLVNGGGGGSRTRVLLSFHLGIYKFSWNFPFSSVMSATNLLKLKHLLKSYCCYGGVQQPA